MGATRLALVEQALVRTPKGLRVQEKTHSGHAGGFVQSGYSSRKQFEPKLKVVRCRPFRIDNALKVAHARDRERVKEITDHRAAQELFSRS